MLRRERILNTLKAKSNVKNSEENVDKKVVAKLKNAKKSVSESNVKF